MDNRYLSCQNCKYYKEKSIPFNGKLCLCSKSDKYPTTLGLFDECDAEFRKCFKQKGGIWKKHSHPR